MAVRKKPVIAPGTMIGKYEVIRPIGSGNMGAVYEAQNTTLEKRVALKTLHQADSMKEEVVRRLVREGRTASRIRHPNVVEVYDVDTHEGLPYLVMEFLEGEDLGAVIAREGVLPVERIADTMLPVIAGVAAAHEQGVVHRDLKPDNIFLTRGADGTIHPKVLDFGVSKVMSVLRVTQLTRPGVILGTPVYMAPEQLMSSKNADARSDQFSIGVILYEMATGKRPFVATMIFDLFNAIREGKCIPLREHRPEIPEGFEALVLKMLKPTPADRFESMTALGQALLPFASERSRKQWEGFFNAPVKAAPAETVGRDSSLMMLAESLRDPSADGDGDTLGSGERTSPARPTSGAHAVVTEEALAARAAGDGVTPGGAGGAGPSVAPPAKPSDPPSRDAAAEASPEKSASVPSLRPPPAAAVVESKPVAERTAPADSGRGPAASRSNAPPPGELATAVKPAGSRTLIYVIGALLVVGAVVLGLLRR